MARMNWDAENRRARMREWYSDNHAAQADLEKPPEVDDQWDLWARRQVRRSVRRVTEAARERALRAESSEGQILALIETAEMQIFQGDEMAARKSVSSAFNIVQESRTGSIDRGTIQAVLKALDLLRVMTEPISGGSVPPPGAKPFPGKT